MLYSVVYQYIDIKIDIYRQGDPPKMRISLQQAGDGIKSELKTKEG